MRTRARVADWISITTAPFSVGSVIGAWMGWLPDAVANHADSYEKRIAVAIILTAVHWVFLFSLLIHYLKLQRTRAASDLGLLYSFIAGSLGLILFLAVELLILNVVVVPTPRESLVLWLGIPSVGWAFFGTLALLIVQSE